MGIEFVRDELGGIKDYSQPRQGFAYIPIRRGEFVQSQGLHSYGLVCPVQRKALQDSRIALGRAYLETI